MQSDSVGHASHTQQQTAFSIWCFYRSPLLYGGRLTPDGLDMASIAIVTNQQLLHIHQNGYRARSEFVEHTWLTVRSGREELGEEYVLVANINSTSVWGVEVRSSRAGQCDHTEAWSGRVESGVSSVKASLPYAHSAVYIIGNCSEQRTGPASGTVERLVVDGQKKPLAKLADLLAAGRAHQQKSGSAKRARYHNICVVALPC